MNPHGVFLVLQQLTIVIHTQLSFAPTSISFTARSRYPLNPFLCGRPAFSLLDLFPTVCESRSKHGESSWAELIQAAWHKRP